jgi:hypothetical protein
VIETACVCNGRLVYGDAGAAPGLLLLFILPAAMLLIGLAAWLAIRRARAQLAVSGVERIASGPPPGEAVESVEEPCDVPDIVEPVRIHAHAGRNEQSDVNAPFP